MEYFNSQARSSQ